MTNFDLMGEHFQLTRRHFLELGGAAVTAWDLSALAAGNAAADSRLGEAVAKLQYLTPPDQVGTILDKGKAGVAKLPPERLREIGLVPETWFLDVVSDPTSNCVVEQPRSRELGNALGWDGLMRLADKHAIRFMQVCSCTNGPDPFHIQLLRRMGALRQIKIDQDSGGAERYVTR